VEHAPALPKTSFLSPYQLYQAAAAPAADAALLIARDPSATRYHLLLQAARQPRSGPCWSRCIDELELERVAGPRWGGVDRDQTTAISTTFTTASATTDSLMARFGERLRQKGALAGERISLATAFGDLDRVVEAGADRFLSTRPRCVIFFFTASRGDGGPGAMISG